MRKFKCYLTAAPAGGNNFVKFVTLETLETLETPKQPPRPKADELGASVVLLEAKGWRS